MLLTHCFQTHFVLLKKPSPAQAYVSTIHFRTQIKSLFLSSLTYEVSHLKFSSSL